MTGYIFLGVILFVVLLIAAHDLIQKKHPILRNFPVLGHGRYLLEELGPKLRQYIVAGNNEERPFTRDQRHWIAAGWCSAHATQCACTHERTQHEPCISYVDADHTQIGAPAYSQYTPVFLLALEFKNWISEILFFVYARKGSENHTNTTCIFMKSS